MAGSWAWWMLPRMARYTLGIDLGTSRTAAAIVVDGRVEIVRLTAGSATMATAVAVGDHGRCVVGDAAEQVAATTPERFVRGFKRRLGDPSPVLVGGGAWSPEALIGEVLRHLVDSITIIRGAPPDRLGVAHPAHWGPYKLDLFTQAVRMAGLRVDRYRSDPEAAAASWFHTSGGAGDSAIVAVHDAGAGSIDVTVVRVDREGTEIIGNPEGVTVPELADVTPDDALALAAHERLLSAPIRQSVDALLRAVVGAGLGPDDLDAVLVVGFGAQLGSVTRGLADASGRAVTVAPHPDHAVAVGVALGAAGHG
jgi:molecular chaperone DnaK